MKILLAGDSTVAMCPSYEYPMSGWGLTSLPRSTLGPRFTTTQRVVPRRSPFERKGTGMACFIRPSKAMLC
jgi:hypothetical protein